MLLINAISICYANIGLSCCLCHAAYTSTSTPNNLLFSIRPAAPSYVSFCEEIIQRKVIQEKVPYRLSDLGKLLSERMISFGEDDEPLRYAIVGRDSVENAVQKVLNLTFSQAILPARMLAQWTTINKQLLIV